MRVGSFLFRSEYAVARRGVSLTLLATALSALVYCARSPYDSELDWQRPDLLVMENLDLMEESYVPSPPATDEVRDVADREDFAIGYLLTSTNLNATGRAVLATPDRRIRVGGRSDAGTAAVTKNRFNLTRYFPDGSLDTTFNGTGKVTTDFFSTGRGTTLHAIATDSNGKIVAVGRYNFGTPPHNYFVFAVARYNTDGALDTSFGSTGEGTVVTNLNSLNAVARGVAIQGDNKILVAGYNAQELSTAGNVFTGYPHQNYDMAVVRYNVNGTLDTTFNANGILTISFNTGVVNEAAYGVALEPSSGKIWAAGVARVSGDANFGIARLNTNGTLDTTFNGSGKKTIYINSGSAVINAITVQTDNKLLAAGYASNGKDYDFTVARLLTNGNLDAAGFNGQGWTVTDLRGNREDVANAIAMQTDNTILLAGRYLSSLGNDDIALVRYNANGSLDTSFGSNGRVIQSVGTGQDQALGVAYIPGGGIVLTGRTIVGTNYSILVMRYNKDGRLARSGDANKWFGVNGAVTTSIGTGTDEAYGMVMTSQGKFVLAGHSNNGSNDDFAIVRYLSDGTLDTTFNGTGKLTVSIGTGLDQGKAIAVTTDGKYVVAGTVANANNDFAAIRITSHGTLDTTFATTGKAQTTISNGNDDAYSVVLQANSKVVVAGRGTVGGQYAFTVVRWNTNGILDTSFNGVGRFTNQLGAKENELFGVTLASDGKPVAVGYYDSGANKNDSIVLRLNTNGQLDTSFSGDGILPVQLVSGNTDDYTNSVIIQPDGKILLGGGTTGDFGIGRVLSNGTLDTSFSADGVNNVTVGGTSDIEALAIDAKNRIIGVGWGSNGTNNDVAIARFLTDGSLDTTFSTSGARLTSYGTGLDEAYGVAINSAWDIFVGGRTNINNNDFLLMKLFP